MPNTRPFTPSPLRRRVCAGLLWLASLAAAHTAAAGVPTFTRYPVCPDITDSPDIQAVDFNGDGHVDVLVGGLDHVVLCTNNGTGTFTSSTLVAAPGGTNTKVVAADLNRDGLMDLVGIDRAGGAVVWWRNDGGGAFTKVIVAGGVSGLSDVYVSDLDGNGWPDILVAADSSNQVLWWRNNGTLAAVPERLFVSDRDSSNYRLAVIDTASRSQVATITMRSGAPGELARSADGMTLYADDGPDVDVIDVASDKITATIAGAGGDGTGTHLVMDPGGLRLYVASHSGSGIRVRVIATASNTVTSTITSGAFDPCSDVVGLGAAPGGGRLYLACSGSGWGASGRLFVIDTAAGTVGQTATFTNPSFNATYVNAMAVSPDGGEVYVAEGGLSFFGAPGHLEVFDGATGAFRQEVDLSGFLLSMAQAVAVSPDGGTLYVADAVSGVDVVDAATLSVVTTLPANTSHGYDAALSTDAASLYTAMDGTVYVTKTADDSHLASITGSFSSAYNLAVTPPSASRLSLTKVVVDAAFSGADSVRTGDMDHDGKLDVVAAAKGAGEIAWWRRNTNGSFTKTVVDKTFRSAAVVRALDMNGDGWTDLVAGSGGSGSGNDGVAWWRNQKNGGFTRQSVGTYASPDLELADLDGDAKPDVGTAVYGTAQVLWWQNKGSGFNAAAADAANGEAAVELADVNGDGHTDIIESGAGKGIYWWGNNGAAGGTGGPAFGFNAVETQSGSAPAADQDPLAGKIHTKIVGQDFTLDVVALKDTNGDGVADAVKTDYAADKDRTVQIQVGTGTCSSFTSIETLSSAVFKQAQQGKEEGRTQVKLRVDEAGQDLRLRLTDDNGTADPSDDVTGCSTDVFTVRPYKYSLDVRQNDAETAGSAVELNGHSSTAQPIHKAGRPLRVIVQALDTKSQLVSGFVNHTVTLKETKGDPGMRDGSYFYVGGATPGQVTFDSSGTGTATNDTATYNEVGWLYLQIDDDGSYATQGGDGPPNDNSTPAELDILGSGQVQVGRFVPDHFTVTVDNTGAFQQACGGDYTYMSQPFGTFLSQPQVTVTARNALEQTTQNYQGAYWKLPDITESYVHYTPALPAGVSLAADPTGNAHSPAASTGTNGAVTVTFTKASLNYSRGAVAAAPFSPQIDLQFTVLDADGVTCASCDSSHVYSLAAAAGSGIPGPGELRYGRLAFSPDPMDNFGEGPETSPIDLQVRAEYFDGTQWALNGDDTCTAIGPANYDLQSSVQDPPLGTATVQVGSGSTTVALSSSPLAGAPATLSFSAPGALNYGTVQFTIDLANGTPASRYPWLMYDWNGDGTLDSLQGSVRFGPYSNDRWMYMRESW